MANKEDKFFQYHWSGVSSKPHKKSIRNKGILFAASEQEARQILRDKQILILKIKQRTPSFWIQKRHKASKKDIILFSRQMATMLNAGVPLNNTLTLLRTGVKKAQMKQIIGNIQTNIEAGTSFSLALKNSSALFDAFYCDLIATGEQTGHLDQIFTRIALYLEKSAALRSKIIKVMIYPTMVCLVALLVSIGMLLFVIPSFESIFASFNAKLPWLTQKILNLAKHLQTRGMLWLASIFIVGIVIKQSLKHSLPCRLFVSKHLLSLPVVGVILTKAILARFARTLATTFSAGIPLLDGLASAGKSAKNLYFEQIITRVLQHTAGGKPLHLAIKDTNAFPDMMTQMIMIGEESGSLDQMLHKIATIYETEVDDNVDNFSKILEPFIIVLLGLLIGSLILSMYLPMFNLMSVM